MENVSALSRLTDQPALDVCEPLSRAVRGAYESAGDAGRLPKNAMHGVRLDTRRTRRSSPSRSAPDHRRHARLAAAANDRGLSRAADFAIAVGLIGAVDRRSPASPTERNIRPVSPDRPRTRPDEHRRTDCVPSPTC